MGLAGNKNRRKLAKDPNNTRWTRNTDSFGQKILRSQGWAPGQYLGATGAAHAVHHTEANASHIRVILKDDTLGLGAKRGTTDECTGLGAFQDLLGRLNGKSVETVQKERKAREDFQFNLYIERKYGAMRFVRGGLLVGDRIQKIGDDAEMHTEDKTPAAKRNNSVSPVPQVEEGKVPTKKPKEQKTKKRKATDEATTETEEASSKSRKSKKRRTDRGASPKSEDDESRGKKQRKEVSKKIDDSKVDATAATDTAEASTTDSAELKMVGRRSKRPKEDKTAEKAAKKAAKNEKKSKRRKGNNDDSAGESKQKKKRKEKSDYRDHSAEAPEAVSSKESTSTPVAAATPSETGSLTPVMHPGRFHRSRFIAQKRAAVMDATALNQILMIKSQAS